VQPERPGQQAPRELVQQVLLARPVQLVQPDQREIQAQQDQLGAQQGQPALLVLPERLGRPEPLAPLVPPVLLVLQGQPALLVLQVQQEPQGLPAPLVPPVLLVLQDQPALLVLQDQPEPLALRALPAQPASGTPH